MHIFIVHGDLRALACDAWLLPTDHSLHITSSWIGWPPGGHQLVPPSLPENWDDAGVRTVQVENWPDDQPVPWLTNVGVGRDVPIQWYVEGARQFLDAAGSWVRQKDPLFNRPRHLLALPIVGTGLGGARWSAGEVVQELLPVIRSAATRFECDIALVTNEGPAFAAAQAVRKATADPWPELSPQLMARARSLAELANRGELVLFLGAGIGKGGGLPLWGELIDELADEAGMNAIERAELQDLSFLDQARILEGRLKEGGLVDYVVKRLDTHHYGLSHALLAALPVAEIVTTNYDRLFEYACTAAGRAAAVLPHEPAVQGNRWVLKMHGCISRPDDIVLTRQDYLRYAEQRAALAGIVQTMLITRHMLFVGFSLSDENFVRIADAVRKALPAEKESDQSRSLQSGSPRNRPPSGKIRPPKGASAGSGNVRGSLGTSLVLRRNPLFEELWKGELNWVATGDKAMRLPEAARRLEIFLDYLLACTGESAGHLLDARYRAVLDSGEQELADALTSMTRGLSWGARKNPAWVRVERLLRSLGGEQLLDLAGESEIDD